VEFCRRVSSNQVGIIRSLDLNVAYTAGPCLQSLLGNPKDKVNRNEKSGIYEINCKDCNQKYIGQTKRPIITRFKEHMAHRKFGRFEKSSVAQHIFESDHRIDETNLKLVAKSIEPVKYFKNDLSKFLEIWYRIRGS
jgi:hypothetical protein